MVVVVVVVMAFSSLPSSWAASIFLAVATVASASSLYFDVLQLDKELLHFDDD